MSVRRNVVGIGLAALALAVNELVGVRRNVVRIGLAALALTLYEGMSVRGNVVGILCATSALTVGEAVTESLALGCAALTGSGGGAGCIVERVHVFVAGEFLEQILEAGDLTCYVLNYVTRGEAEESEAESKHEQRD